MLNCLVTKSLEGQDTKPFHIALIKVWVFTPTIHSKTKLGYRICCRDCRVKNIVAKVPITIPPRLFDGRENKRAILNNCFAVMAAATGDGHLPQYVNNIILC